LQVFLNQFQFRLIVNNSSTFSKSVEKQIAGKEKIILAKLEVVITQKRLLDQNDKEFLRAQGLMSDEQGYI